ncbi:hypothetical protein N6H14_31840 [Paenibacillus sp. CC-CFT747]|nr:hypothetical protein N6H14_31840 [Paenibacillus sp. CC-CFT747]
MLKAMGAGWFRERTKKPGSAGRFYRKSLIMIFIVAGVPGLIIGGLLYGMAGGRVKSELLQLHYRQIEQRSHNIDDQLGNLELLLSHWAFDSKFDTNLIETNFVQNYEKTNDITKTLLVMEGSNSMVKKVELYLGGERRVLFNPEYTVLDNQTASAVYEPLIRTKQVTYWSQKAFDAEGKGKRDLILVHQIPGGTFQPFGVLLLRFDGAKVASLLSTLTPYNDGETFLSQDSGDLFVSSSASASNSPLVMELKKKVGTLPASKGSFFYNWKGTTYTVSYGKLSRISEDWTLVSASPITQITAPVVFLSKLIVAVSLCALLLAALLAWLASRQIYSPVNRLVQVLFAGKPPASREREDEFALIESHWHNLNRESRELNTRLAEQLPHVKEGFLHQLLQGYLYAYSEEDLRKRMERFKWPVEGRKFIILYLQLTGITSMGGKFRYGDEGLVTFAAVNMIDELAAEHFGESNTINFHDLTAGVLLMVPGRSPMRRRCTGSARS